MKVGEAEPKVRVGQQAEVEFIGLGGDNVAPRRRRSLLHLPTEGC